MGKFITALKLNIKSRLTFGTIFSLISAAVALVAAFVYLAEYRMTEYYDVMAVLFPVFGLILYLGLSFIPAVEKFAPVMLWGCTFCALLYYVHAVYMYLSEVFYSGITKEAIMGMNPAFVTTALLYIAASILTNVAAWLKQRKPVSEIREGAE